MKRRTTFPFPWTGRKAGILAVALALAAAAPTKAQVFDYAGDCPTSRAQASIDEVSLAMLHWLADVTSGLVPPSTLDGPTCLAAVPVELALVPAIAVEDLRALLVPAYIDAIPGNDPWGQPYDYRLNLANPLALPAIAMRSAGSDRLFEGTLYVPGATGGPEGDLVRYNGARLRQAPRLDPVSRQLTTAAQLANLGAALLNWVTDNVLTEPGTSRSSRTPAGGPTVDLSQISPVTAPDLAAVLTPLYIACVPEKDGWGHPLDLRLNDDFLGTPVASIRSAGSDGLLEGEIYDTELFPAEEFHRDLVWSDGLTFQGPSPSRTQIFTDDFESATLWGTWTCGPGF